VLMAQAIGSSSSPRRRSWSPWRDVRRQRDGRAARLRRRRAVRARPARARHLRLSGVRHLRRRIAVGRSRVRDSGQGGQPRPAVAFNQAAG
jgi:hypothetical protein